MSCQVLSSLKNFHSKCNTLKDLRCSGITHLLQEILFDEAQYGSATADIMMRNEDVSAHHFTEFRNSPSPTNSIC